MLVLSVAKAMSLDPASGAQDWDVRVGPLREVDSDMGKDTLRAFRLQIGGSFKVRATTLVYPIDYSRDQRGRYIIYTTPRDVHEAVVGREASVAFGVWWAGRTTPDGQRACRAHVPAFSVRVGGELRAIRERERQHAGPVAWPLQ